MDGLIAFLRARLDERAEMVRRANAVSMNGIETIDEEAWSFLADPDWALADVAAKRAIVRMAELADQAVTTGSRFAWINAQDSGARSVLMTALAELALPYADHPDYREEWKP